ncbi:Vacuolar protein sorting-associated protein 33B, partial [Perkinsus olseni]
ERQARSERAESQNDHGHKKPKNAFDVAAPTKKGVREGSAEPKKESKDDRNDEVAEEASHKEEREKSPQSEKSPRKRARSEERDVERRSRDDHRRKRYEDDEEEYRRSSRRRRSDRDVDGERRMSRRRGRSGERSRSERRRSEDREEGSRRRSEDREEGSRRRSEDRNRSRERRRRRSSSGDRRRGSGAPKLDNAPVDLAAWGGSMRRELLDILHDHVQGTKTMYLDPSISPDLSLLVEVDDLKSHGVDLWRKLDADSAGDAAAAQDSKQIIFMVHAQSSDTLAMIDLVAEKILADYGRLKANKESAFERTYTLICVPYVSHLVLGRLQQRMVMSSLAEVLPLHLMGLCVEGDVITIDQP